MASSDSCFFHASPRHGQFAPARCLDLKIEDFVAGMCLIYFEAVETEFS